MCGVCVQEVLHLYEEHEQQQQYIFHINNIFMFYSNIYYNLGINSARNLIICSAHTYTHTHIIPNNISLQSEIML